VKVIVTQPLFAQDATKTRLQPYEALSLGYLIASLRATCTSSATPTPR
jgi:hypothetical protein